MLQDGLLNVDESSGVLANDSDPEGSALTLDFPPGLSDQGGTISFGAEGDFDYLPPVGFWGRDTFEYTVQDAAGNEAEALVEVYVRPVRIFVDDILENERGFVVSGSGVNDVAWAGDVDGDGREDFLFGGAVVFGKSDSEPLSVQSLGAAGFTISGDGVVFSEIGDFDGDGFDDIGVGDPAVARAYVVAGGASPSDVELPGDAVHTVVGGPGTALGVSIAGANVNNDDSSELVVGSPGYDSDGIFNRGEVRVIDFESASSFSIFGSVTGDSVGRFVAAAGDANTDGFGDIAVSSVNQVSVVFGSNIGFSFSLGDLGNAGFSLVDDTSFVDSFPTSISGEADINGDGRPDLLVSVVQTNNVDVLYTLYAQAAGVSVPLPPGVEDGFTLHNLPNGFEPRIDAADFDLDDLGDIAVGVPAGSPNGVSGAGDVFLVTGSETTTGVSALETSDRVTLRLSGTSPQQSVGESVAVGRDVDGDGWPDMVVGTSGSAYVMFGVPLF